MYKKLSRSAEINNRLRKEKKIHVMDSKEDLNKIIAMNEYMGEVRRDYIVKDALSEISASKVILNS
jgi:hypothetical protein